MIHQDKNSNPPHLINENIHFPHLLLVEEQEKKIVNRQEALDRAHKTGLDLICISPSATPPVCKLVDYKKYLFDLNKKKKNKKVNTIKEIKLTFKIEDNDLQIKLEKIKK
jgi:translation initiation factor IF-3